MSDITLIQQLGSDPCKEPLGVVLDKEVCVTVDGSTDSYEVFKVYTRDAVTGLSTLLHYETKQGVAITGTIEEVCCKCDSLCDYTPANLNRICFGYLGSFNGDTQFPSDKANIGANIFIEYFEVDGNVIVSSQTAIGNTGVATFSDAGYGIAYDSVVNLLNASILGSNDLEFVPAGNINPDIGWGVKYNDAKSYKLIISDFIPTGPASGQWTIVLNPTEQWDGIGSAIPGNFWTSTDFRNNVSSAQSLVGCQSL